MKRIILLLIPVLLVFSSIQNIYANPTELPVRKENTKLNIFDFFYYEEDEVAFVSLSDIYPYKSKKVIIPKKSGDEYNKLSYAILDKYRENFLTNLKLHETDNLYWHNYLTGETITLPVKDLKVVARVDIYQDDLSKAPFEFSDYMLGFDIPFNKIKSLKDSGSVLIYIGAQNPFTNEALQVLTWKKIDQSMFPKTTKSVDKYIVKNVAEHYYDLAIGDTYLSEAYGYRYYMQDRLHDKDSTDYDGIFIRRLIIVEPETNKVVLDTFYENDESTILSSFENDQKNPEMGVTGKLFVDTPLVIFGLGGSAIFGCNSIEVIGNQYIRINCDNRH
ncbi:hypothetical protein BHC47_04000 [Snodgrassella alvi]|uniref:Uncharacterized protein n=1 Tax=Snodgrassella alvi TaxID=1196083 RepID=A0A2N9Y3R1_9NEIS|nr:hypothetical protein [Snodgrassella alvi]PIT62278.1 hypothetical protein BHC47_04000 [Snodgrassella alvi]PIT65425.1 hypothetical protein BHC56_10445 [Snodgrassella alvi]